VEKKERANNDKSIVVWVAVKLVCDERQPVFFLFLRLLKSNQCYIVVINRQIIMIDEGLQSKNQLATLQKVPYRTLTNNCQPARQFFPIVFGGFFLFLYGNNEK
jgi:hypothetical protein